jgi:glutamine amidotransferase
MSSLIPAGVELCLHEFACHGGLTASNKDGWGIASYAEDGAVRLIKEAEPASGSEWVEFIETHNMRSTIVLSHIRRATRGSRSLKNTQPFRRELVVIRGGKVVGR